ncbi:MAG: type I glyceraldehyde-3-phosphate dehydrogenase [Verrucomicrobiota bacterium JB022]|nr:type I glyceraldehyde-3-phosphate dehydrogenase [Verrucomicrobiota bacterium JB022]
MIKVAINGFGRIGRLACRALHEDPAFEVVAINDLGSPAALAYLLEYDTAQGKWSKAVSAAEGLIAVGGQTIRVYAEKDPSKLPWKALDIDLVLECTGFFTTLPEASLHLSAGARRVIVSAPAGKEMKTIVYDVNHETLDSQDQVISCASCTTNCLAPMAKVLHREFGIVTGQMSTIHAYTNSQPLLDTARATENLRGLRAAATNVVPYTTGAAKAIGLVIPELAGKLDGSSQRVPVDSGSLVELYTVLEKEVDVERINAAMRSAASESFGYNDAPLVSSDVIGMRFGSLFDATQTKITQASGVQLLKTVAWYDNEMSFVSQMLRAGKYLMSCTRE